MKRHVLLIALLAFVAINASAQKNYNVYAVGFYNVENLFDTEHDEGKNDYEYTPNGGNKWNELKYTRKLHNMARARTGLCCYWTFRGGECPCAHRPLRTAGTRRKRL